MSVRPSVCYVAPYDSDYSRNVDVIRALEASGVRVETVRGRRVGIESGGASVALLLSMLMMVAGTLLRTFDVLLRLLRCRALVVGYLGQLDMLLLGPIARALGRPVIFNPLVTLTDTLVEDRRLIPDGSPAARVVRMIDRLSLRLADIVLVDTDDNRSYVSELADIDTSRIAVLPVGVDERIFHPSGPGVGGSDGLDVLFYGKFIPLHGTEWIVRAAAALCSSHPNVRFELIGTGQEYQAARDLADALGATNICWTDWLPYSELGERLRRADIALGVFDGGGKAARVIPNKVHQALACGVPVITREGPAAVRLLCDGESALLVPPDNPGAIQDAIVRLANDRELRQRIGSGGRAAWERYASDEQLAGRVRDALRVVGVVA